MVCLTFLVVLSFGPLGQAVADVLPPDDLPLRFAAKIVGAGVAVAIYMLLVRLVERRRPTELEIKPAAWELPVGLLIGFLMFAAVMGILLGGGFHEIAWNGAKPAWKAAGAAIEAGIVEELIVRAVILRLLWRALGPAFAFVASAALFGLGHLPNEGATWFAAVCVALEAGVMLSAFYALTGRLWVSIGVHVAWNFTQGYVFGAAVSGGSLGPSLASSRAVLGHSEWLTGGAFGPEASLPALLVCSFVGFTTLWAAWSAGRFDGEGKHPDAHDPLVPATA
jgi:membrane protease YdiL (CAAX protease family)